MENVNLGHPETRASNARSERGSALLMVMIISFILMVLVLGLTFSALAEFSMSNEYECHVKALMTADSGYAIIKNELRKQDLNELLKQTTMINQYIAVGPEQLGAYSYRDARPLLELRNIDFDNPPSPVGSRQVTGLLTPGDGRLIGEGRFFARISDNNDGDGDLLNDSDSVYYIRVIGIQRELPGEIPSYGGTVKNAVAVIETMVKKDSTLNITTPLVLVGPETDTVFDGNSFDVVGDENFAAIGILYHDLGIAGNVAQTVYDSLSSNQFDNVIGAEGPWGEEPSIRVETENLVSQNPDAANLMDPYFLAALVRKLGAIADVRYTGDTHLSGGGAILGTPENPQITWVDGNLALTGSGKGAGILVVTGRLDYNGAFDYDGMIFVIGEGTVDMGGVNKNITGGMLVAALEEDEMGGYTLGRTYLRLSGNSNFIYDTGVIDQTNGLIPLQTILWREITPDIDPS